jgi:hypothetical protein
MSRDPNFDLKTGLTLPPAMRARPSPGLAERVDDCILRVSREVDA